MLKKVFEASKIAVEESLTAVFATFWVVVAIYGCLMLGEHYILRDQNLLTRAVFRIGVERDHRANVPVLVCKKACYDNGQISSTVLVTAPGSVVVN